MGSFKYDGMESRTEKKGMVFPQASFKLQQIICVFYCMSIIHTIAQEAKIRRHKNKFLQ